MAGGVGTGRPFAFNVKCIVFTAMVVATWRFLPRSGVWPWMVALWWPYVAMAWYDELYACSDVMEPTALPFGRALFLPFKPPGYKKAYENLPPEKKRIMDRVDHVTAWVLLTGLAIVCLKLMVK